ncbi:Histone deacetylase 6 [Durusdinium trenchii]|uniref:Histone deacetylase 6 n=1 Tax=Durusdinium trenchii TaxID=1381693 RepID=A0ABP0PIA2_9DINO
MKSFATVLMLGQIAEEFHEISESMKVLRQSRLSITRGRRLLGCWLCISIQYIQALMVMVTSGQVILGRQNPIEPLWMTYYVFMTLSFDNMSHSCSFMRSVGTRALLCVRVAWSSVV